MDVRLRMAVLVVGAGLALAGATPAAGPARAGAADKPRVAVATEAEAWLAALRRAGTADLSRERVLVVDADGRVLDSADGQRSTVDFPDRFVSFLRQPTPTVTLVHNHPGNRGLSEPDLAQLGHPGVARVIAVGNDGSLYEARRGPAFNVATFIRETYPNAKRDLDRELCRSIDSHVKLDERVLAHYAHALSLKLAKAGVLTYRAQLDPQRQLAWDAVRVWFLRAGAL